MTRRRKILLFVAGLMAITLLVVVVLHSSAVQHPLMRRIAETIEDQTGWRVVVEDPDLRLWPARFLATDVLIGYGDHEFGRIERLEARWRWFGLLGQPRRLESVEIEGADFDLRDFPEIVASEPPSEEAAVDPWRAIEIERLVVRGGRTTASAFDVEAVLEGFQAKASLEQGRAQLAAGSDELVLVRDDRRINLGPLAIRGQGSAEGVAVEELNLGNRNVVLQGTAEIDPRVGGSSVADFEVRADLVEALGWWDPNLVTGLDPAGSLDMAGKVSLSPGGGIEVTTRHRGDTLRLAGYLLDELELGYQGGMPVVRLAGETWGAATVAMISDGVAEVDGSFRQAPVERILAFVVPQVASVYAGPVSLSGDIKGTVAYPFVAESLSGEVDLVVDARLGRAEVRGHGAGDAWILDRALLSAPGVSLTGSGSVGPGGRLNAMLGIAIDDIHQASGALEPWFEELRQLDLGGGPLTGSATLSGTLAIPEFRAEARWERPSVMGSDFEGARLSAAGDRSSVDWSGSVEIVNGSEASADGVFEFDTAAIEGDWRFAFDNLERTLGLLDDHFPDLPAATGRLGGDGEFQWQDGAWKITGRVEGFDLGVDEWRVDRVDTVFELDPGRAVVHKLQAEIFGGAVFGRGTLALAVPDGPVDATLGWRTLDLGRTPFELPELVEGAINGELTLQGTLSRPAGVAELAWSPHNESSSLPSVSVAASLEDGVIRMVTEEISAEVGTAVAEATLPLGAVPRPEWLWPEAPSGAFRLTLRSHGLRSDPITAALGYPRFPLSAFGDLSLEAGWHPAGRSEPELMVELQNLRIRHAGGEIVADGPLTFNMAGNRASLSPVVLSGPETRIEAAGGGDLETGDFTGRLDAELSPAIARMVPYPVQIYEPIHVTAEATGTSTSPRVTLSIRHPGGALVVRDPPLQIRDLVLAAEVVNGVVWVTDGRATVNQGTVELGGGWDPVSRQGLVAELEGVVLFVEGILSQWTGVVAIEPEPGRLAKVTGELNLVAGLWDQHVNLAGAFLGGDSLAIADDDPLNEILLDLDIRGRGTVRVENNLGRFDARWDVLRVSGPAANPRIDGEISISPGGRLSLAGQNIKVRRGSLLFTGDPAVDPIVEIVPESDVWVFGGEEGGQLNTTSLATQSLVQGIAGALGFENETLQPAEISVETERDTSSNIMIGQRLNDNVALFFATNATDVQDRTSMIQFWNFPGLKGLAVQGYEKTLTEEIGGNVVQRFRWGGTSLYEDRPTIRRLVMEGDWPVGKRRLRKATGFRRGQPYDPFLLFVGEVRMEREMAIQGYQNARVAAKVVETGNSRKLVFSCDPGPRREVIFEGDEPPRAVRGEVTALYQGPPLEAFGFRNMAGLLDRHFDAAGYADAEIVVERRGETVVARVAQGEKIELIGPVIEGLPDEVAETIRRRLGAPTEMAVLAREPERARLLLERVLGDQGYHDATVASITTEPTRKGRAEVRVSVEAGSPAIIDEIFLVGADPLGLVFAENASLKEGMRLTRLAVDTAASRLRAAYDAQGYSDAIVRGSIFEDGERRWVVTVDIQPGMQRRIEGVVVNGLHHTSQRSVMSGVTLEDGEILKNADVDRTAVQVANFSPIERVDVRTVPQGSSGARVELDVVEKPRWTTEVGGGWSSERGVQARFGLRDDNLFGRGLSLNLRGRWDQTEWLGFVVASLPPLPSKRLLFSSTVGFSRGDNPEDRDKLTLDESFWSVDATRYLGPRGAIPGSSGEQVTAYYQFTRTRNHEKDPCDPILDPFFCFPIDITTETGLVGARYARDRFDYLFDPRAGYGLTADLGTSREILGSDFPYWTFLGTGSLATEVLGSSTWFQTLRVGVAEPVGDSDLTSDAKFFAGGQGSIRGFDRNTVGPVEYGFDGGWDPEGGGALFILNEELRVPIKGGFRAAVFVDIGQVWESWGQVEGNLRLSVGAGVGIRWATPIGPVWADVAWPVANPVLISSTVDLNDPSLVESPPPESGLTSPGPKFYIGIGRPF